MRHLKRLIRSPYLPMQQCINRIMESQSIASDELIADFICKQEHNLGPSLDQFKSFTQYKVLIIKNYVIKLNESNNCVMAKS